MALAFPSKCWGGRDRCLRCLSQVLDRKRHAPLHEGLLGGRSLIALQRNQHFRLGKFEGRSDRRQKCEEKQVTPRRT